MLYCIAPGAQVLLSIVQWAGGSEAQESSSQYHKIPVAETDSTVGLAATRSRDRARDTTILVIVTVTLYDHH